MEDFGDGARNDAHAVVGIRGVGFEVDAGHGVGLAAAGLAVRENCAVEALHEAGYEGERGGREQFVLGGRRAMDLVKGEELFFGGGCGGRGRGGDRAASRWASGGVDRNGSGGSRMDDRTLEAGGDGCGVLRCGGAYPEG